MRCLILVSFVVLINVLASKFFNPSRGLRKLCPQSPLLFFIIVESLSMVILDAMKRMGAITEVKMGIDVWLSHLLFVDDVLLFVKRSLME
jgi:hypothetical protein